MKLNDEIFKFQPLVFKSLTRIFHSDEYNTLPTEKNAIELLYVNRGGIDLIHDNYRESAQKGQAIIIHSDVEHKYQIISPDTELYVLYLGFLGPNQEDGFKAFFLADFMRDVDNKYSKQLKNQAMFWLKEKQNETVLKDLVFTLYRELHSEELGNQLLIEAYSQILFIYIIRKIKYVYEQSQLVKNAKGNELIEFIKKYMINHFAENISVPFLADLIYISPGYFSRLFKDYTGLSPKNYILQIRVARACEMLKNKSLKISIIANQSGFRSVQRLSNTFKKNFGITPAEYRKNAIKREAEEAEKHAKRFYRHRQRKKSKQ